MTDLDHVVAELRAAVHDPAADRDTLAKLCGAVLEELRNLHRFDPRAAARHGAALWRQAQATEPSHCPIAETRAYGRAILDLVGNAPQPRS